MTSRGRVTTWLLLAALAVAAVVGYGWYAWWRPYRVLGSMRARGQRIDFYIASVWDADVVGFTLKDESGRRRYFLLSSTPIRQLHRFTLDVFLSESEDEMWVYSSWEKPNEALGYYRVGGDTCIGEFGEQAAFDTPVPEGMGGSREPIPPMDPAHAKKVLTLVHTRR